MSSRTIRLDSTKKDTFEAAEAATKLLLTALNNAIDNNNNNKNIIDINSARTRLNQIQGNRSLANGEICGVNGGQLVAVATPKLGLNSSTSGGSNTNSSKRQFSDKLSWCLLVNGSGKNHTTTTTTTTTNNKLQLKSAATNKPQPAAKGKGKGNKSKVVVGGRRKGSIIANASSNFVDKLTYMIKKSNKIKSKSESDFGGGNEPAAKMNTIRQASSIEQNSQLTVAAAVAPEAGKTLDGSSKQADNRAANSSTTNNRYLISELTSRLVSRCKRSKAVQFAAKQCSGIGSSSGNRSRNSVQAVNHQSAATADNEPPLSQTLTNSSYQKLTSGSDTLKSDKGATGGSLTVLSVQQQQQQQQRHQKLGGATAQGATLFCCSESEPKICLSSSAAAAASCLASGGVSGGGVLGSSSSGGSSQTKGGGSSSMAVSCRVAPTAKASDSELVSKQQQLESRDHLPQSQTVQQKQKQQERLKAQTQTSPLFSSSSSTFTSTTSLKNTTTKPEPTSFASTIMMIETMAPATAGIGQPPKVSSVQVVPAHQHQLQLQQPLNAYLHHQENSRDSKFVNSNLENNNHQQEAEGGYQKQQQQQDISGSGAKKSSAPSSTASSTSVASSFLSRARNSTINLASLATVTHRFNCSASVGNLWSHYGHQQPRRELAELSGETRDVKPLDYVAHGAFDQYDPSTEAAQTSQLNDSTCSQNININNNNISINGDGAKVAGDELEQSMNSSGKSQKKSLFTIGSAPVSRKSSSKEKKKRQEDAERVEKLRLLVSYLKSGSSQPLLKPVTLEADEIELAQRYKLHLILCEDCLQQVEIEQQHQQQQQFLQQQLQQQQQNHNHHNQEQQQQQLQQPPPTYPQQLLCYKCKKPTGRSMSSIMSSADLTATASVASDIDSNLSSSYNNHEHQQLHNNTSLVSEAQPNKLLSPFDSHNNNNNNLTSSSNNNSSNNIYSGSYNNSTSHLPTITTTTPGYRHPTNTTSVLATWIDNEVNSLVNDLEVKSQLFREEKYAKSSGKRKWLSGSSSRRNSSGAHSN